MPAPLDAEVFTPAEIAAAAGVADAVVNDLIARGAIATLADRVTSGGDATWLGYVPADEAVRAVRALRAGEVVSSERAVLASAHVVDRPTAVSLAVSTGLHGLVALTLAVVVALGWAAKADEKTEPLAAREPIRMVYLALPGPGGGGGGGGLREKLPPPKAQREGIRKISSPLPSKPLPVEPKPKPVEPPPPPLETKPVVAPIASAPADRRDAPGVLEQAPPEAPPSQGPGIGGGAGTGRGTGIGEGDGNGVGDGSGGGTGGGPYRPGSGVEPPRLLHEVKADFTDEARRANISGEVDLEITVRRDGTVGDVRVLRGLPGGLNDKAVQAVRQWKFAPARLKGTPVDVIVEVSVEFKLR